jgi:CDP-diacylglycerol--glycerol-3-phosphate 3-phosphatidyltransferase
MMELNTATVLTLLRIALIPVLVLFFYLPVTWANWATTVVFGLAAITDWADGYIARRFNQVSPFGEFLDPVADKLMVATALVLLVQYQSTIYFTIPAAIIVGREITISALREWMAGLGHRANIGVASLGKVKTTFQMIAVLMLLFGTENVGGDDDVKEFLEGYPFFEVGHLCLWIAAILTIWSMVLYLRVAWPSIAHGLPPDDS